MYYLIGCDATIPQFCVIELKEFLKTEYENVLSVENDFISVLNCFCKSSLFQALS